MGGGGSSVGDTDDSSETSEYDDCSDNHLLNTDDGDSSLSSGGGSSNSSDIEEDDDVVHYVGQPQWGDVTTVRPAIEFDSVENYEVMAAEMEMTVQRLLAEHPYNTVGNLLRFYDEYKKTKEPLLSYYKDLSATLTPNEHTCVGLGLELLSRLKAQFPKHEASFRIASSEEGIEKLEAYLNRPPSQTNTEKEHVVVMADIEINQKGGKRSGILILDPGYHVARVVTVMHDGHYPNTGWFVQADELWVKREYRYTMARGNSPGTDYILWQVKETRPGKTPQLYLSLLYSSAPYLSEVSVTEKRNLVYNYRSWLARSPKGDVIAGVHFPLMSLLEGDCPLNVIYTQASSGSNEEVRLRKKLSFRKILDDELTQEELTILETVEIALGRSDLLATLKRIGAILEDSNFINGTILINRAIYLYGT